MNETAKFLPVTRKEMESLGWDSCDIILVTGDAYVDHPSFGAALIGRYLESMGYRVGVIPQPDIRSTEDFLRLGTPELFVGITSGAMDSMVNHYTSLNRIRSNDAYSEGGKPGKRPDRALLKYVNLAQRCMPGVPIVIGGIEASLRRLSHYDYWSDRVRKSILLDTKADILVYGMGERAVGSIADALSSGKDIHGIRGTAVYTSIKSLGAMDTGQCIELPSHEEVSGSSEAFMEMTKMLESEISPFSGTTLIQRADSRAVIVYPPQFPLSTEEMDRVYELPYSREPHPVYTDDIPAFSMIQNSITVVRGCAGGCSFCALGLHQGKLISSRSLPSVVREVETLTGKRYFARTVSDLGGPTANLYGLGCAGGTVLEKCRRYSCLYPDICENFKTDHESYIELLDAVAEINGVRNVFVSSGIRYDVALRDTGFIKKLVRDNVSGYLKIAPEHFAPEVLELMRKPSPDLWRRFKDIFERTSREAGREQYIEPYILVAFPGCDLNDMYKAADELRQQNMRPEKSQIFLPTPMTMATAMYYTGISPDTGLQIYVASKPSHKRRQLEVLPGHAKEKRRK
ncbi:YgiQ family radical SAM protein [Candidatus Fermentibacteria bacterium]|nr:MAG: YgiQ family radical SAM protein [Candidatus Fermentibacteria bacterium]